MFLPHSILFVLNILINCRKKFAVSHREDARIYTRICLATCIFWNGIKGLPIAASANCHVLPFTALVASSRHGPDIKAPGSLEDPERCGRDPDNGGHSGARGMHKKTAGHFRGADRFPRGRRAGGQPVGEDTVRLSMSAWLRWGQKLRHRMLHFGLGVPGTFHAVGAWCSAKSGIPQGGACETSRFPESAWDQDQIGSVARTSKGLPRSLPSQSRRINLLKWLFYKKKRSKSAIYAELFFKSMFIMQKHFS